MATLKQIKVLDGATVEKSGYILGDDSISPLETAVALLQSKVAALETQALDGDSLSQQAIDKIDDMEWEDVSLTLVSNSNGYRSYSAAGISGPQTFSVRIKDSMCNRHQILSTDGIVATRVQVATTGSTVDYISVQNGATGTMIQSDCFAGETVLAGDIIVKRRVSAI